MRHPIHVLFAILLLWPIPVSAQEAGVLSRLLRWTTRSADAPTERLAIHVGTEAAEALTRRFGVDVAEAFARHGEPGIRALERLGPELARHVPAQAEDLVRALIRHGDAAADVLRNGGPEALRVVASMDGAGLRFAQAAGADTATIYARGGSAAVYQALRHPEFVPAAREAIRVGALDRFLAGTRQYGDAFVVWVGRRWKEVGFLTALATFVAVAPGAVHEAGQTARESVRELGGWGVLGSIGLAIAGLIAWDLLRRRYGRA